MKKYFALWSCLVGVACGLSLTVVMTPAFFWMIFSKATVVYEPNPAIAMIEFIIMAFSVPAQIYVIKLLVNAKR